MPTTNTAGARIITSRNVKGGVGKTHVCSLIAGVCEEQKRRYLVLDLDKQGNLSSTLMVSQSTELSGTECFFNPAIDASI